MNWKTNKYSTKHGNNYDVSIWYLIIFLELMRAFYVINRIPASVLGSKIPLKIATNKTGDIIINLIPFYSPVLYIMLLIRMRELLKK